MTTRGSAGSRTCARDARHHEALPGRGRQRPHRPRRPARRDPRASRRERRRQDDADEHPLRAGAPGRGRDPARWPARSTIAGPSDAIARGISMVHQHFMLVPVLTVAENILLGEETMAGPVFLDRRRGASRGSVELGRAIRLRDRSRRPGRHAVGRLAAAGRDPQGALPRCQDPRPRRADGRPHAAGDRGDLRASCDAWPRKGHSIVFISHKLYEVLEIADRITVIRRGQVVGQRLPAETNEDDLAELMVGREVQLTVDRGESQPGDAALVRSRASSVKDDRGTEVVRGVDLEVRAGEILGIAGRRRQRPGRAGRGDHRPAPPDRPAGSPSAARTSPAARPRRSNEAGVGYVPADRHRFGLVPVVPAGGQPRPDRATTGRRTRTGSSATTRRSRRTPSERSSEFDVRTPSATVRAGDAVGRQPAEGGRRPGVRPRPASCSSSTSRPAASTSAASSSSTGRRSPSATPARPILLVSAELDEVLELSDRIAVMYRGQHRRGRRRPDGRQERDRPAHGDRRRDTGDDRRSRAGSVTGTARSTSGGRVRDFGGRVWSIVALPLISILLALVVGAVVILASQMILLGRDIRLVLPLTAYASLIQGLDARSVARRTSSDRRHARVHHARSCSAACRSASPSRPACSTSAPRASS